jgi:hypothetical protein
MWRCDRCRHILVTGGDERERTPKRIPAAVVVVVVDVGAAPDTIAPTPKPTIG